MKIGVNNVVTWGTKKADFKLMAIKNQSLKQPPFQHDPQSGKCFFKQAKAPTQKIKPTASFPDKTSTAI